VAAPFALRAAPCGSSSRQCWSRCVRGRSELAPARARGAPLCVRVLVRLRHQLRHALGPQLPRSLGDVCAARLLTHRPRFRAGAYVQVAARRGAAAAKEEARWRAGESGAESQPQRASVSPTRAASATAFARQSCAHLVAGHDRLYQLVAAVAVELGAVAALAACTVPGRRQPARSNARRQLLLHFHSLHLGGVSVTYQ